MSLTIFMYGLVFFVTGLAITVIALSNKTSYKFIDKLVYLGIFLIVKGVVEWEHLFFPIRFKDLNNELFAANLGHRLFVFVAMAFLTVYGIELLIALNKKARFLRHIFGVVCFGFFTYFFIYPGNIFLKDIIQWSLSIENASRLYIALPGGLLASIAIFLYARQMKHDRAVNLCMQTMAAFIAFYAIVVGVFTFKLYEHGGSPDSFYNLTGVNLEVLEIAIVLAVFGSVLVISRNLKAEYTNQKLKIRDVVLIGSERERIARDMHDGAIQTLYGLSLRLGYIKHLIAQGKNREIEADVIYLKTMTDEVINDIRNYIYNNLSEEFRYENLEQGIQGILHQLKQTTNVKINFVYINKHTAELHKEIVVNIYFVIKEAILNIIKHANATAAEVKVEIVSQKIYISIKDDGVGIEKNKKPTGMGLVTMRKRVQQLLNGKFKITQTGGTLLEIEIPLGGELLHEQESIIS